MQQSQVLVQEGLWKKFCTVWTYQKSEKHWEMECVMSMNTTFKTEDSKRDEEYTLLMQFLQCVKEKIN